MWDWELCGDPRGSERRLIPRHPYECRIGKNAPLRRTRARTGHTYNVGIVPPDETKAARQDDYDIGAVRPGEPPASKLR